MNLRARYTYGILFLLLATALIYGFFSVVLRPDVPTNVKTKFLYEPGHDITNPTVCLRGGRTRFKVLIGVISSPSKRKERMAIRNTWGNFSSDQDVVMAFFVGRSLDPEENEQISLESKKHSDIVRGNSIDSYRNLTLKTISYLEWSRKYCTGVQFILKVDDDVFVNVNNLLTFVEDKWNSRRTIYGELGHGLGPLWWMSKWYVTSQEYDKPTYPDFVFGGAYLITSDSVDLLYKRSLNTIFFKLEDVFITGIVAESLGITRTHSPFFIRIFYTKIKLKDFKSEALDKISVHGVKYYEHSEAWNAIQERY